ncbi:MAG: hypothetical protein U9R23_06560 [Candidatus Cloacimonadota bacterium]|nr:hypothetical protein [Candidatus Cloacimonadota bacterium]
MKRFNYLLSVFIVLCAFVSCTKESTSPENELLNPTNLELSLIDNNLIKLNWDDNSTKEIIFCIDRKKGEEDWLINYNEVAENITTFNDYIPTTTDTVYSYRVRAFDGDNYSYYTNIVGWFSSNSSPSNLSLEQITQDSIKITWQDNSVGEEGFSLDRKIGEDEWIIKYTIIDPNETQYTDYSNSLNEICYYRISAFSGSSNSITISDSVQVILPAPTNLTSTLDDNTVLLNWNDNSNSEDGFYIERKTPESEYGLLASVTENVTNYSDNTIENNIVYYYRVYAYKQTINSNYSNETTASSFQNYILVPEHYNEIQQAINSVGDGHTILVSPGTYYENLNFLGKEISLISYFSVTNDRCFIEQTIIDGNQNGSCVLFVTGETENTLLQGFKLINGSGTQTSSPNTQLSGGGIACRNYSNPNLFDLIITENTVSNTGTGGGIHCSHNASPYIKNVIISNNFDGGGLFCWDYCNIILENVIISGNYSFSGGAMYCSDYSNVSLINVTIANNYADYHDGIGCQNSDMTILNSVIWNYQPIYVTQSGTVSISYSDIRNGWEGIGNIDVDPLFFGYNDFHLQSDSPCIDTGNPDLQYNDADGSRNDMGAYGGPNGDW